MPSAEELEQMLDEQLVVYERMLRMEASKARGDEHHVDA